MAIARKPPDDAPAKSTGTRRATPRKPVLPGVKTPPTTLRKKVSAAGPVKATPAPRRRAAKPAESSLLDRMQAVIVAELEDGKAEDIVVLNLEGRAAFADRMIIATAMAERQMTAIATHIGEKLAEIGIKRLQIEGAAGSDWVLIDTGDIIVHLFKPEARAMYGLERMWGAELDEPEETSESL
jgi:ribosome silencing factor RsfS/YbeB/iojap